MAIRVGSKDSSHVGDFIIGQCSSCFFFVHDLQSGENVIQVETKVTTPRKWYQPSFTTFVKLTNPFYDTWHPWENTKSKSALVLLHCHKMNKLSTLCISFTKRFHAFVTCKTNELKIDIYRRPFGIPMMILSPKKKHELYEEIFT